ncbi:LPS export ABC transporter periplasmic protein LptC [Roseomonas rosulenta]|uniref:LPS export ABC transporter periplasmic protein LptC n=1 Tax=Roseomonas rosulenta TaxID=2748667 RepID=UPI001E598C32|nr:LPS export ABC transporter periplasmic protein LptC [Roseomonas rosulenta]
MSTREDPRVPPPVPLRATGPMAPRRMLAPSRGRWTPSAAQIARRRLAVRLAKWLFPILGVGLLVGIAVWPELDRMEDRARVSFRRVIQAQPDAVRLVEPRYQGLDEQNRPFTVTADVAAQTESADIVDLTQPRADILLTDGTWVLLESREGRFDKARNRLDLNGDVTLWQDGGNLLVTATAEVLLQEGSASGDSPVAAQGPFGTLVSEGFRLTERGQVVVFTGRAHAILEGGQ